MHHDHIHHITVTEIVLTLSHISDNITTGLILVEMRL